MKNPSVVIIKKARRGGHGGHHGGAWKVAYADFVTAMMAFFLVMWLVAQSNVVKAAIAGYFKDPGVFDYETSNGVIPGGEMKLDPSKPAVARPPSPPRTAVDTRADLERAAGRLKAVLSAMPEFKKLRDQIEIQVAAEGLRIELVEKSEATFFDSGSATLKPETERILAAIVGELRKLSHPVVVEGHTDRRPFSGATGYTNWELSADRANAARRAMERSGLPGGQILAVRGFADRQLRVPDLPNDPRNRRVSIVVPNSEFHEEARDAAPGASAAVAAPSPDAAPPSSPAPARGAH